MIDADKVGRHIHTLRKEKGLTQAQLADRLDISYQAVSKWESGTSLPDTALLVDIARILETTVDCIPSQPGSLDRPGHHGVPGRGGRHQRQDEH